jgi:RNA polymerase sigma-70 factor (ECF subfamily)
MPAAAVDHPATDPSLSFDDHAAMDEADLVDAARRNSRAAFANLHARYATMVHGMLLARVPLHDVDDLMQEVFLTAMNKVGTIQQAGAFGPWLAALTRNIAASFRRSRAARTRVASLSEADSAARPSRSDAREEALRILELIRELPEAYRESLILRLVEGLTGPQIAASLGMTHGSVRINLHRGMQLLREKLDPHGHNRESPT